MFYSTTNSQSSPSNLKTLYLHKLADNCTEFDLLTLFSTFGCIEGVKIVGSDKSLGFARNGIVKFCDSESATRALNATEGRIMHGKQLQISLMENSHGKKPTSNTSSMGCASVHVTYFSDQVQYPVNRDSLVRIFTQFGEVIHCCIKRANVYKSHQSGYGFIHFANDLKGMHSGLWAVENFDNVVIDRVNYKCNVSGRFYQQLEMLRSNFQPALSPSNELQSVRNSANFASSQAYPLPVTELGMNHQSLPQRSNASRSPHYEMAGYPQHTQFPTLNQNECNGNYQREQTPGMSSNRPAEANNLQNLSSMNVQLLPTHPFEFDPSISLNQYQIRGYNNFQNNSHLIPEPALVGNDSEGKQSGIFSFEFFATSEKSVNHIDLSPTCASELKSNFSQTQDRNSWSPLNEQSKSLDFERYRLF